MRAIQDKVIIKLDKWEAKQDSGLILSEQCEVQPCDGVVVSVGPNVKEDIKVGDRVRAERWQGIIWWDDNDDKHITVTTKQIDWIYND